MAGSQIPGRAPTVTEFETDGPLRMVWRHRRVTPSASAAAVSVLRLDDMRMLAGRSYLVMTSTFNVLSTVANDRGTSYLYHQTDGWPATTASPMLSANVSPAMATAGDGWQHAPLGMIFPTAAWRTSILLHYVRTTGTGLLRASSNSGYIDLTVFDTGPAPAVSGVNL